MTRFLLELETGDDIGAILRRTADRIDGAPPEEGGVIVDASGVYIGRISYPPRPMLVADPFVSSCSIDLEATNPGTVVADAARFHVGASPIREARGHGSPTYRYTGAIADVVRFLAWAYGDESGESPIGLLARALKGGGSVTILEARCTRCGQTFNPADVDDLEHVETSEEVPCGGRGELVGSWGKVTS